MIEDDVLFGPQVMIIAGNHTTGIIGRFMRDILPEEKPASDDQDVLIQRDVWVGARATILQGVCIGRGVVIGAGAVVTRSIPPYAIAAGCPAKVLRFRWAVSEILKHEAILYPSNERLEVEYLERTQKAYK